MRHLSQGVEYGPPLHRWSILANRQIQQQFGSKLPTGKQLFLGCGATRVGVEREYGHLGAQLIIQNEAAAGVVKVPVRSHGSARQGRAPLDAIQNLAAVAPAQGTGARNQPRSPEQR
jgi:hypothetical protein